MSYFTWHNRALCRTNDVLDYLYKEKVTFMEAVKLCASRGNLVRNSFQKNFFDRAKFWANFRKVLANIEDRLQQGHLALRHWQRLEPWIGFVNFNNKFK